MRGTRALLASSFLIPLAAQAQAQAPAQAQAETAGTVENRTVTGTARQAGGGGLIVPQTAPKSVSTVTADFIAKQAPSANAFQLAQLLPGANVSMSDPFGLSQQVSLTLRGLSQDELGYTLEGMPLNDLGYYSAYPAQFADSENLDSVSLAQGAADLDAPLLGAAGGILSLSFRDPARTPGGQVEAAYGSYHANREFIRVDTGAIGNTGIRAFLSYSHTAADNWRGPGRDWRDHIDVKAVREWGQGNRVALAGTYHDALTSSYPEPTQADWKAYGRSNNYDGTYTPGDTNYWRLYQGTFHLAYVAAPTDLTLADHLALHATPYFQWGYGNSPGGTTLNETGLFQGTEALPFTLDLQNAQDGAGTVLSDYTQQQYRSGSVQHLDWTRGRNTVELGYWFEYDNEQDRDPFTLLSPDGNPGNLWANSSNATVVLPDGRELLAGFDRTITKVNTLFVADTLKLLGDRLTLQAGFKEAMVTRDGWNMLPGPQYRTSINSAAPLPRLGARFQITPRHQIFASVSTNFRTPSEAALFDVYDPSSGSLETQANTDLRNEYSISEEIGYRYTGDRVIGSVSFFNYNITNRQIDTITDVNGALVGNTINAGGQTSRGIDAELGLRPWHHLSPYLSAEYLHATMDNDFETQGDVLPTAGKTAIRSPHFQGALGLTYDDGTIFGTLTVKYVGAQYATFMNDEKIADHTQADLALGYRLPRLGPAKRPELRLNVINLTDENTLSGVANPTPNARDTTGRFGTIIAGSAPTYYLGGGFATMLTVSSSF